MKDSDSIKIKFSELCTQMEDSINDTVDAVLASYQGNEGENNAIRYLSQAKEMSKLIECKMNQVDVDDKETASILLDEITSIINKRSKVFHKLLKIVDCAYN